MSGSDCINRYSLSILIVIVIILLFNTSNESQIIEYTFPDGFLIGTASSSYQVEGAWNESGKSETIWDYLVHNHPEKIADRSTGDISSDSYHKYKEDIKLLADIGVNHYRFSLSWARILPSGYADSVNQEGIRFYHNILDELEKYGIEPFVTIYHWDHPQSLERLGGWTNDLMAYLFSDYAAVVFKEFGDRVKFFSTINEPYIFCKMAYRALLYPPNLNLSDWGEYTCVHNMIKAHALAYHIYDDEFRSQQKGQVGIVLPCFHHYSKDENDLISSEIAFEFECGWTANPIFSKAGDYPEVMKQMLEEKSKLEGRRRSPLPKFSKEWIEYIRGSSDYLGLNHYSSYIVEPETSETKAERLKKGSDDTGTGMKTDTGLSYSFNEKWLPSQSAWLKIAPEGLGDTLRMIKKKYNNPPVYILENGVSDGNHIDDNTRIRYLHAYMKEMLIAMKRDKCNVKAYTVWSFLDSFEWISGYTGQFGLVHVDFNDPNRKRTPKKSVFWLRTVLKTRELQPYE